MAEVIVQVKQGKLLGKVSRDMLNENFYSFQGIPYARPPVGDLRFKAPLPPEKWQEIRDATKEGPECYARHMNVFCGSEDCLFLNVFTKEIKSKNLKPVMVWIHGGAFTTGSSQASLYGPEYLITEDIVLVTLNYRLGVLGFLCMEDDSLGVPGNAGLKDTVMALKWVQANIRQFGGDPNNVTIFGESAGAASVHLLMLSPMPKGLFHKAIAQSGTALNDWAESRKSTVYTLAQKLGIETNDQKRILEYLQELPVEDLVQTATKIPDTFFIGDLRPFGPVVEKATQKAAFISQKPEEIIISGKYNKVPLMMGYCSREGMFYYGQTAASKSKNGLLVEHSLIPHSINLVKGSSLHRLVAKRILEYYFKGGDPLQRKDDIYRLYTDNIFFIKIVDSVKHHLRTLQHPLYFFRFDLDLELNLLKKFFSITDPGACHADDFPYLFKNDFTPEVKPNTPEFIGIQRMVLLWTNFAKYGNPTPEDHPLLQVKWEPVAKENFNFLNIGNTLELRTNPDKESVDFWEDLYKSAVKSKL